MSITKIGAEVQLVSPSYTLSGFCENGEGLSRATDFFPLIFNDFGEKEEQTYKLMGTDQVTAAPRNVASEADDTAKNGRYR